MAKWPRLRAAVPLLLSPLVVEDGRASWHDEDCPHWMMTYQSELDSLDKGYFERLPGDKDPRYFGLMAVYQPHHPLPMYRWLLAVGQVRIYSEGSGHGQERVPPHYVLHPIVAEWHWPSLNLDRIFFAIHHQDAHEPMDIRTWNDTFDSEYSLAELVRLLREVSGKLDKLQSP